MDWYKGKRILVTGGAGFIGSHIAQALVAHQAQVVVLDNLSTGSLENLADIRDKITFIRGSVTDSAACLAATKNVDVIFHLAAFISVPQSMQDPLLCYEHNVHGTAILLDACRQNQVKRFVFSSSSAVYGNHQGTCSEQTPCNPTSPYGLSKLMGEQYTKQYAELFGVRTINVRYFNVYGERQNPQGSYAAVVAKFTECLKHNQPITIFGDGQQTRDFVHVSKVVQANLTLAMLPLEKMNGDVYNIATGTSVTLLDLLTTLRQKFPTSTSSLHFESTRHGDIINSSADCSKLNKVLQELR